MCDRKMVSILTALVEECKALCCQPPKDSIFSNSSNALSVDYSGDLNNGNI